MKPIPFFRVVARMTLAVLLVAGAVGCSNRYKITLTNGNVMTSRSRPKLDPESGAYLFKDINGQPNSVPSFKVKEIEAQ